MSKHNKMSISLAVYTFMFTFNVTFIHKVFGCNYFVYGTNHSFIT